MTNERRRQVLGEYFDATVAQDFNRLGSLVTDDVAVHLPPSATQSGFPALLEGREAFLGLVRHMSSGMIDETRPFFTARSIMPLRFLFDDESTVAAHLRIVGDMPNGAVYDNEYVFLYTFDGDKVTAIREFTDTAFIMNFVEENAELPGQ